MARPNILITRPAEQAKALAVTLKRAGFSPLLSPIFDIRYDPEAAKEIPALLVKEAPQAIITTSQHALLVLARAASEPGLPILVIGDASSQTASELGFKEVHNVGGEASLIPGYMQRYFSPGKGPLLYLRGEAVSLDLTEALKKDGFQTVERIVYRAEAAETLSPETIAAISDGALAAALFYSTRNLQHFETLAEKHGLIPELARMDAVTLSENIAEHATRNWRRVVPCDEPTTQAMLACLKRLYLPSVHTKQEA